MKGSIARFSPLIVALAFDLVIFQTVFLYLPLHYADIDGLTTASVIRAVEYVGPVVLGYYIGMLVDKFNARLLLVFVYLILAISICAISYRGSNLIGVTLLLTVVSVSSYISSNTRNRIVTQLVDKDEYSKANSVIMVVQNTASMVAPALVAVMSYNQHPQSYFYIFAAGYVLVAATALIALRDTTTVQVSSSDNKMSFFKTLQIVWCNTPLRNAVAFVMGNNAFVAIYPLFMITYSTEIGAFTNTSAPLLVSFYSIIAILSGVAYPWICKRLDRNMLLTVSALCLASAAAVPLIFPYMEGVIFSGVLSSLFSVFIVLTGWTIRQEVTPVAMLGRVTGVTSALFKLSMIISLSCAGVVMSVFGYTGVFILASVFAILGALPMLISTVDARRNVAQGGYRG